MKMYAERKKMQFEIRQLCSEVRSAQTKVRKGRSAASAFQFCSLTDHFLLSRPKPKSALYWDLLKQDCLQAGCPSCRQTHIINALTICSMKQFIICIRERVPNGFERYCCCCCSAACCWCSCFYQIFKVLKLFRLLTDHN